jgi:hypothetical protein
MCADSTRFSFPFSPPLQSTTTNDEAQHDGAEPVATAAPYTRLPDMPAPRTEDPSVVPLFGNGLATAVSGPAPRTEDPGVVPLFGNGLATAVSGSVTSLLNRVGLEPPPSAKAAATTAAVVGATAVTSLASAFVGFFDGPRISDAESSPVVGRPSGASATATGGTGTGGSQPSPAAFALLAAQLAEARDEIGSVRGELSMLRAEVAELRGLVQQVLGARGVGSGGVGARTSSEDDVATI